MADFKSPLTVEDGPVPPSPAMSTSQQALDLEHLPDGYYRSINFIGSLVAVCLMAISLYLGFSLPVLDSIPWTRSKEAME